jgi:hypothetical protein
MTSPSQQVPARVSARGLDTLRGNCMGAAILLILQFAIGMGVNLYVTIPAGKTFLPAIFGSAVLAAHVIVALFLLGASVSALVRSIRIRRAVPFTAVGLVAILTAAAAGSSFVGSGTNAASLTMALATAVATAAYVVAVFRLR